MIHKKSFLVMRLKESPGLLCQKILNISLWGASTTFMTPDEAIEIGKWLIKWGKQYES